MEAAAIRAPRSIVGPVVVLSGLALGYSDPARALEFCKPGKGASYTLPAGETHEGDLYTAGQSISIAGTQHGDLVGVAGTITVMGDLEGDLMVWGELVNVLGRVGDSARIAGKTVVIEGTIEGDVLIFAQTVSVGPNALIDGDAVVVAQILTVEGRVAGRLKSSGQTTTLTGSVGSIDATVGEFRLQGQVERDANITCDTLNVDPASRVGGNLIYTSRQPLEGLDGMGVAAGKVEFVEKTEDDEESDGGWSVGSVVWILIKLAAALIVGCVLIAIFQRQAPAIEKAIAGDALPSLGVGFVLTMVLPVAAVIVCFLIVTIPLAAATFTLWLIGLYVAKLPVAMWLGRRVLRAAGSRDASPYVGLVVGLVVLYLAFEIPFLIGFLTYWATAFLGFGAMFLGIRAYRQGPSVASAPAVASSP
jgi:cytoskeletal protein CcmA (bactofilin family)